MLRTQLLEEQKQHRMIQEEIIAITSLNE
jgi:hypothetical protein